jgi:hypothetical protein
MGRNSESLSTPSFEHLPRVGPILHQNSVAYDVRESITTPFADFFAQTNAVEEMKCLPLQPGRTQLDEQPSPGVAG